MAVAPSHPSQYAAAIPSSSSTSPPLLSAMAAPFIPKQVQEHHALQPVTMQNRFPHHHPMMYQNPYQMPPGQIDAQMFYSTMPRPHPGKHLNASSIKTHNRALSQQKDHMYQEWMLAQHQRASPPVSVSRKPSIVMPEGDYIGYYFKPKSDYVGYYMKDKATATETDSTQTMSKEDVATHGGRAQQASKNTVAAHEGPAQQMSKEGVAAYEESDQQVSKEGTTTNQNPAQQVSKEEVATHGGRAQQMSKEGFATHEESSQQVSKEGITTHQNPAPQTTEEIATQEGQAQQTSEEGAAAHGESGQPVPKEGTTTNENPAQQMSEVATEKGPDQQVAVAMQEVVISPGGDVDYRVSRQGLTSFLPLLPLDGPILYQTKLAGDYNGPKEPTINTSDDHNGGFLPLLGPAPKAVSKHSFSDLNSESTMEEVTGGPTESGGANSEEHKYQGGRKEYVGYSYATVRGRKA